MRLPHRWLAPALSALLAQSLGGCASMRDYLLGQEGEGSGRAPASIENPSVMETNTSNSLRENTLGGPSGPTSANTNEYANQIRLNDDRARRGFRRDADPWMGTGVETEGSLWTSDSQDNFYFSRNNQFKVGDFVVMSLDNDLKESLNIKMAAMYKADRKATRTVVAEEAGKAAGEQVASAVQKATGNEAIAQSVGADTAERTIASIDPAEKLFDVKELPLRIVEVLPRGALKVEGSKKIFKKNQAYELKVQGTVRDEDLGSARTIASSRLMESKVELTK